MVRWSSLLLLLAPGLGLAAPAIWLQPALGTPTHVEVSGRVLKSEPSKGHSVVSRNVRRLASSNWEGAEVEVSFAGQTTQVRSGHDGDFEVQFDAPPKAPFPAGFLPVSAHVRGASATTRVEVLAVDTPFLVVSDLDDTLAVTHVRQLGALLTAALAQDETTQPVVEGMPAFYRCLRAAAEHGPGFMLVSGSPLQYVDRIAAFLTRHDFPPFALSLRDLGPSTLSHYKEPIIRALLRRTPFQVVLVGDSGERDPEVYRAIRDEFPGRVAAIYIRDAGHAEDAARFEGMLLFKRPQEALADAIVKGLAPAGCGEPW